MNGRIQVLVGIALIVALVLAFFGFQTRGQAALGNVGYPIYCVKSNVSPGNVFNLTCYHDAAGTAFSNVPTGYYLLVTDAFITPSPTCGTDKGLLHIYIFDSYVSGSTTYNEDGIELRELDRETFGFSFQSPGLIVQATHFLRAEANGGNVCSVDVRVYGWLVTNLSFLPVVTK